MKNPFEAIGALFHKVFDFFNSDKGHQVLNDIGKYAQDAAAIVQEIDSLVPNKKVEEILAAYNHYGKSVAMDLSTASDPVTTSRNALLNLGVSLLRDKIGDAGATIAESILQSAVTLAVAAAHA